MAVARTTAGYIAVGGIECLEVDPVAGRAHCLASVWRSSDLAEWIDGTEDAGVDVGGIVVESGPQPGFIDVAARADTVVTVGYREPPGLAGLTATTWRAVDGAPFEETSTPVVLGDAQVEAITAWAQGFAAVGVVYGKTRPRAAVWLSVDGLEWERVADQAAFEVGPYQQTGELPGSGRMRDLHAAPGGIVSIGDACVPEPSDPSGARCAPAAWTSPDGRVWARAEVPVGPAVMASLAKGAQGFVAVGQVCAQACIAVSFTSADGATWEGHPLAGMEALWRVAAGPDGFLGLNEQEGALRLWRSRDGVTWREDMSFPGVSGLPFDTASRTTSGLRGLDLLVDGERAVVVGWAEIAGAPDFVAFAVVGPASTP